MCSLRERECLLMERREGVNWKALVDGSFCLNEALLRGSVRCACCSAVCFSSLSSLLFSPFFSLVLFSVSCSLFDYLSRLLCVLLVPVRFPFSFLFEFLSFPFVFFSYSAVWKDTSSTAICNLHEILRDDWTIELWVRW